MIGSAPCVDFSSFRARHKDVAFQLERSSSLFSLCTFVRPSRTQHARTYTREAHTSPVDSMTVLVFPWKLAARRRKRVRLASCGSLPSYRALAKWTAQSPSLEEKYRLIWGYEWDVKIGCVSILEHITHESHFKFFFGFFLHFIFL